MTRGEELIERYVRYPETLSPSRRRTIEAYLCDHPPARQILAFYTDYYEELDAVDDAVPPTVSVFVDATFRLSK